MEKRKTRILFADDEPAIRMTLPTILQHEGFEVSVAATVAEALAYINRESFDVLLADLNIGERGDGFTLISAMRRVQPQAVTLILTGYPDFETALQAIRNQVDDYLTKPTDVKELVTTIKERSTNPRRVTPLQVKRVSMVLRESADEIVEEWLQEASKNTMLSSLPLSKKARMDHIRLMVEELAKRIEAGSNVIDGQEKEGATKHGQQRYEQGYTVRRIAIEARLLHSVISRVLHKHLLVIDMSTFISDIMLMGEGLHEEFEESIRAFEEQSRRQQTA
ncbi:MAG TPA: response regulator [Candidatus Angelobacter sp.]|jgi:two-component system response regulator RegA|nr:response regulator [Candidatus Angelobacter sp.]